MEVTIQDSPLCTIIKKPFDAEWVKGQLALGIPVSVEWYQPKYKSYKDKEGEKQYDWDTIIDYYKRTYTCLSEGELRSYITSAKVNKDMSTITILPPLPRHPKPEDAALLYRYASEGLYACMMAKTSHTESGIFAGFFLGEYPYWSIRNNLSRIFNTSCRHRCEITHAVDSEGNKHDIAISEDT